MPCPRKPVSPLRYFNSSPKVIRLMILMYVGFPLSLRKLEDLLFERGIDVCHETIRMLWNRFGPMLAADIRRQRVRRIRGFGYWSTRPARRLTARRITFGGLSTGRVKYSRTTSPRPGMRRQPGFHLKRTKAARQGRNAHDRWPALLWRGNAQAGQSRATGDGALSWQPSRKFTPCVLKTRTGHAAISADEEPAEIRLRPCQRPQPLQPMPPSC
jgi:hypothetical protein